MKAGLCSCHDLPTNQTQILQPLTTRRIVYNELNLLRHFRSLFSLCEPGLIGFLPRLGRCPGDWEIHRIFLRTANDAAETLLGYFHRFDNEFRHAVRPETSVVVSRVFLGDDEGFMDVSFGFDIGQVRPRERVAVPLAAECDPSAVGRPTVPRFALVAVDLEASAFGATAWSYALQINDVKVGTGAIDREAPVIAHAEQKPATIGADPWQ